MFADWRVRSASAGRTAPGGADIRVTVFGGIAVDRVGLRSGVLAGQRKCLALLAALAVAGRRGVARDKLMTLLGPELDTIHARNALSQVVFRARRALGQRIIEGKDELILNPSQATSDVGDFERALADGRVEDAVALYRGPFLDGFYLRAAREFERWTADVRARLEREYLSALDTLATDATRRGDAAGAVAWCHRRLDADAFSVVAARRLVQALVESGDREGALRVGRAYAERMRLELDLEPDAEFSNLLRTVRAGRTPAGRAPDPAPATAPRDQVRARARAAGRVAAAAAAAATLIASTLLLASKPATPPLVLVPPFVNATGDPLFDTASTLAAEWTTQGVAATGLLAVADIDGALRPLARGGSRVPRADELLGVARRRGASLVVRGELSLRGTDSVAIDVRIIRVRDGAILLEGAPTSARGQSAEMLAKLAGERAIGALATLLARSDRRLSTD